MGPELFLFPPYEPWTWVTARESCSGQRWGGLVRSSYSFCLGPVVLVAWLFGQVFSRIEVFLDEKCFWVDNVL